MTIRTVINPGRLRFLCASLGAVAERPGCTFISSRELGALLLFPESGPPQSALFGKNLLLLDQVEPGLWLVDGETDAGMEFAHTPALEPPFAADAAAEGVF
mgnify:CR=1 FL=1